MSDRHKTHLAGARPKWDIELRQQSSRAHKRPCISASPLMREIFRRLDETSLTNPQILKKIHMSPRSTNVVSNWRRGRNIPTLDVLDELAKVVG